MAYDCFLQIPDILGESRDPEFDGAIEVLSYSWGLVQQLGVMGDPTKISGRVSVQDLVFTKKLCRGSLGIFLACSRGNKIAHAVLCIRQAGYTGEILLRYILQDVYVSSYTTSYGGNGELPIEQVSLTFGAVKISYRMQNADGSLGDLLEEEWKPY